MTPADISAVIVTRGDVPLHEILESLYPVGFHEIVVWANHQPGMWPDAFTVMPGTRTIVSDTDLAVYGRYAAIERCRSEFIYVQDDDCLIDAAKLIRLAALYDTRSTIIANMPESRWSDYPDSCLVGWGAIFHRDLPAASFVRIGFDQVVSPFIEDDWSNFTFERSGFMATFADPGPIRRECDVVFTTLTPHIKVDIGFQHLPWAEDPERAMYLRSWRQPERDAMYELARQARDA